MQVGLPVRVLPAQRAERAQCAPSSCTVSMALVVNAEAIPIACCPICLVAIPRATAVCSVWSLRIARVSSIVIRSPGTVYEPVVPTCHVLKTRTAVTSSAGSVTLVMKTTSVKARPSAVFAPSTAGAACSAEATWAASRPNFVTNWWASASSAAMQATAPPSSATPKPTAACRAELPRLRGRIAARSQHCPAGGGTLFLVAQALATTGADRALALTHWRALMRPGFSTKR